MKKVAIFDIDGTIFRSSLVIELVKKLIERDVFPEEAWKRYRAHEEKWLNREGSYEKYVSAVVETFMKHIKGVSYADFADIAEEVVLSYQGRVYCYTRDLIKELKDKKYYLLAISHSPKTIVDPFCKKLGFNKMYGIVYEIGPTDRFTGNRVDEHLILNKANIVRRAVEREGLTLRGSVGVGDTESDISFLELVEKPIAFNPNKKLYRYAKRMEWPVVVERKDVIYKL